MEAKFTAIGKQKATTMQYLKLVNTKCTTLREEPAKQSVLTAFSFRVERCIICHVLKASVEISVTALIL